MYLELNNLWQLIKICPLFLVYHLLFLPSILVLSTFSFTLWTLLSLCPYDYSAIMWRLVHYVADLNVGLTQMTCFFPPFLPFIFLLYPLRFTALGIFFTPRKHTHTHTHTHTYTHTRIYTQKHSYKHKHTHTYIHKHTHMHTQTHTQTYTYKHSNTQIQREAEAETERDSVRDREPMRKHVISSF